MSVSHPACGLVAHDSMTFRKLQWLFPIAVTLHNAEEAIWMPRWTAGHAVQLPLPPPGAAEIWSALVVFTVAAFAVTYLSARRGPESIWAYLMFGYIIAMLANVFLPHVPAAIVFRGYAPGAATAVLINLPVMSLLTFRMLREEWVHGWKVMVFGIGVPLMLGGVIVAWLAGQIS